jgi:hypothetical protein
VGFCAYNRGAGVFPAHVPAVSGRRRIILPAFSDSGLEDFSFHPEAVVFSPVLFEV